MEQRGYTGIYSSQRRNYWNMRKRYKAKTYEVEDDSPEENTSEKKERFEDYTNQTTRKPMSNLPNQQEDRLKNDILEGRRDLDKYLLTNFTPIGYRDALANSDYTYAEAAKKILLSQLEYEIKRALSWYEIRIEDCESRITLENRIAQLDIAEEVACQQRKLENEKTNLQQILTEVQQNNGIGLLPIYSYDRGFKRGRAAITCQVIFGKSIPNE